ncbi:tRNA-specific adenosine-34 deaminase [Rubellimicrobium mesophilum DSM 19309]|uniref:tRNA-specific adenosine-34 deaminase n=1 Tax=Rubellimicrobium mesophilum DSM 19309 TaxID=442562 RepID=A0A017HW94_9RHOB|nr:nucleoside deaminase [Rubellimicrobium mesophilum]EYD78014.1 tRNA-specific adenosine-34 deaminase [Rubellimicrobium mesophilum DSM 19309]
MPDPLGPPPDAPSATEAEREALREAVRRAWALADDGKAAFVAAVMSGDRVIAMRANEVGEARDPSRHAEIVAIAAACEALGRVDLAGATLVTTLQPCEMCLAAMRWAGIGRVVFAARQEAVHPKYFQFGGLRLSDFQKAGAGFTAVGGVLEEAIDLYADGDA